MPRTDHKLLVSVAASLLGHGALILVAVGVRLPRFESPIPIELLPSHRSIPAVGERERRGEPRKEPMQPRGEQSPINHRAGKGISAQKEPRARAASASPETTDLSHYAPGDAHLVVLLKTSRLRHSPHRATLELLLRALPDYRTLLAGTQISLLDDLDALLIATSDPRNVYASFLAAKHHVGPKVEALVSRSMPRGDPRVLRVLSEERIVLLPRAEAAHFDAEQSAPGEAQKASWLALLDHFDQAGGPSAPALTLTLSEANSLIRLGLGLPTPRSVLMAMTAERAPTLRVELVFDTNEEAVAFSSAWPSILERWHSMTGLFGLAPAFDGLALKIRGHELEIAGTLPETQMRLGLSYATGLLPSRAATPSPPPLPKETPLKEMPLKEMPLPEAPPDQGPLDEAPPEE